MILTDEEIEEVRREWLSHPLPRKFDNLIRASAKAQSKKVVEWGRETCYEHLSPLGGLPLRRKDCEMCWQALLEETKEG